jgi:hypothetical protein
MISKMKGKLKFGMQVGWIGAFTRAQAKGAWRNGTRVRKIKEDPGGDRTPIGSTGMVLGSLHAPEVSPLFFYFIEWDNAPRVAVGCTSIKLEKVETH